MNYGKKITKAVICSLVDAMQIINAVKTNGQMFRVDFIKRTDGTIRTIVGRCGVKYATTGAGAAYKAADKALITVFESGNGYRTVPIEGILGIKQAGVWYDFTQINGVKSYTHDVIKVNGGNGRTLPAKTSPLFSKQ